VEADLEAPERVMTNFTGPPVDLNNIRSLGVMTVDVYCGYGHQVSVDLSALAGDVPMPDFRLTLGLQPVRRQAVRSAP
jgi:hypothetical protein